MMSAYCCIARHPHLAFVSKLKALIANGNSVIFTININVNRMTKQLAGNMWTYAEGEYNSLVEMGMGSVCGEYFRFLSIGDIVLMFTCSVCFCDCF
jgi:hypothetical protein